MKPHAKKNRKLTEQYPFVRDILYKRMEPHAPWSLSVMESTDVDDLTIRVEKADGDLMFRRADNVGLGESSCIFGLKGDDRKDQVMRRGEYAFAVDKDGRIINRLDFPRNQREQCQSLGEVYAWQVLWLSKSPNATGTGYLHSGCLCQETKYLVWVTVEAWHTDTKDHDVPDGRFGEFRDRSIHITIYGEPDQGFKELQEQASVYENLWLDTRVLTRGALNKNHDIVSIGGMLYEMCIMFQDEVYFNGMKEVLDGGEFRGASGQFGGINHFGTVKVLCAEMCGYDRVMLEDTASYVTFQLRPGSKHMYVLGQQGKLPQIRNLVRTVVRLWRERPDLRAAFKPNPNVSVM